MILTFLSLPGLILALLHTPGNPDSKILAIASGNRCTNPKAPWYGFFGPRRRPGSEKRSPGIRNAMDKKSIRQNIRKRVRNSCLNEASHRWTAKISRYSPTGPGPSKPHPGKSRQQNTCNCVRKSMHESESALVRFFGPRRRPGSENEAPGSEMR